MKDLSDECYVFSVIAESIPDPEGEGFIEWCEKHVTLVGSTRSSKFRMEISPWLRKAFEAVEHQKVESVTLVMCAQSGKSAFGENLKCWWIAVKPGGDVMENWESDEKGKKRFKKRVYKILKACLPVADKMPAKQTDANPVIAFPHLNFTMQGVHNTDNLESDSITLQINEEVHAWEEGRMKLADERLTAVWNSFQANISTGGKWDDQLHLKWKASSQEFWEEQCDNPECREWQHFHTKTAEGKRGGLRYEVIKKDDGSMDWDAMESTIYYECEHCGHKHYDHYEQRRQRAMNGRYPDKDFARHIGLHVEQVSVYWVKYIDIVRKKLEAIHAMKRGDKAPWIHYIQRSEGWFYDPRYRPHVEPLKKNKGHKFGEGLKGRKLRGMTVDRQRGQSSKGETPYYWIVIRDWISPRRSMKVWSGRLETDSELDALREKFDVNPLYVLVDSGWDAHHVYRLCARYGYTAIKGDPSAREYFPHRIKKKTVFRIYQELKWIEPWDGADAMGIGRIPFLLYSKSGIRDRLETLREVAGEGWGIPEDTDEHSPHYKDHMDSEEKEEQEQKDGKTKMVWVQHAKRNDLFVCECYQTLIIDLADLQEVEEAEEKPPQE